MMYTQLVLNINEQGLATRRLVLFSIKSGKLYSARGDIEYSISQTDETIKGWGKLDSIDCCEIKFGTKEYFLIPSRRKMISKLLKETSK